MGQHTTYRCSWKVYGRDGHRQRESFNQSYTHYLSTREKKLVIDMQNSDITGTNDYSIVRIECNTPEECEREFCAQLSDGIFENSGVGRVEKIGCEKFRM